MTGNEIKMSYKLHLYYTFDLMRFKRELKTPLNEGMAIKLSHFSEILPTHSQKYTIPFKICLFRKVERILRKSLKNCFVHFC